MDGEVEEVVAEEVVEEEVMEEVEGDQVESIHLVDLAHFNLEVLVVGAVEAVMEGGEVVGMEEEGMVEVVVGVEVVPAPFVCRQPYEDIPEMTTCLNQTIKCIQYTVSYSEQ